MSTMIIGLAASCDKEESKPITEMDYSETVIPEIIVEENTLSFDSEESLRNFMQNEDVEATDNILQTLAVSGFSSLRPIFNDLEGPEVEKFLVSKSSKIKNKGSLYSSKNSDDEIDLDDELISDERFAKILNDDREIFVGKNYYVYTTKGLFFCKKSKRKKLKSLLETLENSTTSKLEARYDLPECENIYKVSSEAMNLNSPSGSIIALDEDINFFSSCGGGGGSTGGGSTGGGTTTSTTVPLLVPQNFGSCSYTENSIFQQIFGNTVTCNDYHDSTHRIQTKVWNENWLLWASVGASAKYQKKRLIGWSESSTSDGVRLGINHAIYTYNSSVSPYNAVDPKRVIFKYKGVNYNQYGNVVTSYPINSSAWPFPQNETLGAIEIYIFGDDQYFPLTGKEANKTINDLLSQARGAIRGLSNDMNNDKVGVQIVKFLPSSFKVTQTDILLKNSSKAKKTFDFNFLLSFNSGSSGVFQTVANQLNAEKYDKIEIDMYGAALRNNVWKGKKIRGKVD
ncbi:hypothetical protein [Maribacter sp. R86514]|uniref:hypothetical protein n=1 Tax=Maribacter sp. R86514 TaxID=3093854 RepID=UPI0037CAAA30